MARTIRATLMSPQGTKVACFTECGSRATLLRTTTPASATDCGSECPAAPASIDIERFAAYVITTTSFAPAAAAVVTGSIGATVGERVRRTRASRLACLRSPAA